MTLEELKEKYLALADTCEKKGDEYHKEAQEFVVKGDSETASHYYGLAMSEYHKAGMCTDFVIDLRRIENK